MAIIFQKSKKFKLRQSVRFLCTIKWGCFWMESLAIESNEDIAIISRRRVMLELYLLLGILPIILADLGYLRLLASTPDIAV